ncbi:MAG: hypothetical protein OCD01_15105 [Fibrobacterales bacterium]
MKKYLIGALSGFLIMGLMGFTPANKKSKKKNMQSQIDILKEQMNQLNDRVTSLELKKKSKKRKGGFKKR